METRNNHGFSSMICDNCDKRINSDDSMVVEGNADQKALNMVYHGECWLRLKEEFPQVYEDCEVKRLD